MIIQWYGQGFVRIDTRGAVIAIDPFLKEEKSGITKVPRFRADAILAPYEYLDRNDSGPMEGSPMIFAGPGEYEVQGVFVKGYSPLQDNAADAGHFPGIIFKIDAEEIRLCHMGAIKIKKLQANLLEEIGAVDLLFIPVGGADMIDAKVAWKMIAEIQPKIVVPIYYKVPKLKLPLDEVSQFLKEGGIRDSEALEHLTVRDKDLPSDGVIKVQVLKPLAFAA